MKKNARFEIYNRGRVTITLEDGDTLIHRKGGATEEGYDCTGTQWSYIDGQLYMYKYRICRDCDGPLEQWDEFLARVPRDKGKPKWERISGHQRDQFAERMGY